MPLPILAFLATFLPATLLASDPASGRAGAGPTLAIEDTMHTEVPEFLVTAPRVSLDEILDRVARGEARRDSLLHDLAFTATLRFVRGASGNRPPELWREVISRVYKKKPDRVRSVLLRQWTIKPDKKEAEMSFRPGMEEEIVNFAFRPEAHRDFRYRIVGRDVICDHLIYRIAFEPRALVVATDPGGVVWVDTRDFVIVRQELDFPRSPIPLVIQHIDRAVIERQQVDGHWMLHRVLMRAELTLPLPKIGRSFDISVQFDDYAVNRGIGDELFAKSKGKS